MGLLLNQRPSPFLGLESVHHSWYTSNMPTSNPRLQVMLERPLYHAVAALAKKEGISMSLKARDLIREAIENLEDAGLASIVAERARKPGKLLSLKQVERRLGIR